MRAVLLVAALVFGGASCGAATETPDARSTQPTASTQTADVAATTSLSPPNSADEAAATTSVRVERYLVSFELPANAGPDPIAPSTWPADVIAHFVTVVPRELRIQFVAQRNEPLFPPTDAVRLLPSSIGPFTLYRTGALDGTTYAMVAPMENGTWIGFVIQSFIGSHPDKLEAQAADLAATLKVAAS
jgi:hypothetical protein